MKPTLVILAAGMASRYGGSKQTEQFGPSGEIIMEYSIYDAIRAGFGKVVFIIREDFAESFRELVEPKIKGKIEIAYVYQKLESHVGNRQIPADRVKPWGTAHAVLCCEDVVKDPFVVINADDFYGRDAFEKAAKFLTTDVQPNQYCIVGYKLSNTLSENGTVSRGVCDVDGQGNLMGITERIKIYRAPGKEVIVYEDEKGLHELTENTPVSMNFFGFHPSIFSLCEQQFSKFLDNNIQNIKSEFYMPSVADYFIKKGLGTIRVIPTSSSWFGVTYKADAEGVKTSIQDLVEKGEYPTNLWV